MQIRKSKYSKSLKRNDTTKLINKHGGLLIATIEGITISQTLSRRNGLPNETTKPFVCCFYNAPWIAHRKRPDSLNFAFSIFFTWAHLITTGDLKFCDNYWWTMKSLDTNEQAVADNLALNLKHFFEAHFEKLDIIRGKNPGLINHKCVDLH